MLRRAHEDTLARKVLRDKDRVNGIGRDYAVRENLPGMHAVIVGGGIVGLASAYYLRQEGVDVTVIEQGRIGHGSTPRAGGGIREQFSTPVSIELSRKSIEVWREFDDRFAVDINYRRHGYLYLARTQQTAEAIQDSVAFHNNHDVPSEFVAPDQLSEYCPGLRTDEYVGGTYCPTDGYADTELALQGFGLAAARNGAKIKLGHRVTDILQQNDRVVGVETDHGQLEADFVVNAAGAWARTIGQMAGIDLEITPERRQLAIVEPATPLDPTGPFVTDLDTGAYFRPKDETLSFIGGHFEDSSPADPDTYQREYDDAWADRVITEAGNVATNFGPGTRIRQGWAGLYAMTPDHHPIIEEIKPGFVVAAGFSGHGFMQSPATGKLVSELITTGTPSLLDISPLTHDRFERGEQLTETFYSA